MNQRNYDGWLARFELDPKAAEGIWDKVKDSEHPHAMCVEMMSGKVDDPNAFCAAVEKKAAGTTPAERMAKKHAQQLEGVEIFASGTHNGDKYTEKDLEDIVAAFGELDYQPAVTLGHATDPGAPAVGYIGALRKQGNKLVADLVNVSDKVHAAIKDKLFNRVSAEIYWDLERGGKKFRRALKALALLGAQVPAVAGLKPLAELFAGNSGEVHNSKESEFSTGAASSDPNAKGVAKMDEKEVKALQDRLAEAEKAKAEEAAKREAAEKALAEAKKAKDTSGLNIKETIEKLTSDEKAAAIAELTQKVKAAEDAVKQEREARETAERKLADDSDRIKKLEEAGRRDRIEKLAETCRIPAMRQWVRSFADLATRDENVKVYSEKGEEKSALAEVETFIQYVNSHAQRIFTVVSTEDQKRKGAPDVGKEVDRRAKIYQEQHKGIAYKDAVRAVLDADEQLKADYAA